MKNVLLDRINIDNKSRYSQKRMNGFPPSSTRNEGGRKTLILELKNPGMSRLPGIRAGKGKIGQNSQTI